LRGCRRLLPDMPEEVAEPRRDAAIASLAAGQHGAISVEQLYALGLSSSAVGDRVSAGRLHRIHRGVYAVGYPRLSREGLWLAAVLACGQAAVLSHRSAAELWRIMPTGRGQAGHRGVADGPVDVTVAGEGGRMQRQGIRIHRSITLSVAGSTIRAGIPVTNPARTLEDLRRVLPSRQFARALREAEFLALPIGKAFEPDRTRTDLEGLLLAVVRRHRLPQPEVNMRIDRYVVDFLWRPQRLIVEVDGWQAHRMRSAFEEDRARDARLKILGFEVLRFTWRQIEGDAGTVAQTIRELLRR
jgi:very-short-patch-repair endonuclease